MNDRRELLEEPDAFKSFDNHVPYIVCPVCKKYRCNAYSDKFSCKDCIKHQKQEIGFRMCLEGKEPVREEPYYCTCSDTAETYTLKLIHYINMLKAQLDEKDVEYAIYQKNQIQIMSKFFRDTKNHENDNNSKK